MKHLIALAILLTIYSNSLGQVGIGTTTPLGALDVTATDDGLVIPRVALTITTSALPLTAPTTSELVYNTATVADVTPGYYYWGGAAWVRLASGSVVETDPQVSSATNNTIPKWNGTTLVDGIITDNGTTVSVAGTTSTTNFQMTNGAAANFVLQSNATGNASWVNANTLSISETDPQVTSTVTSRVPRWNGTTLVDGLIFDNTASVGIGTVAPAGVLDITSTNNGLLIPRVPLTATNASAPLTFPVNSEIVFNTATAGVSPNNVTPGYYYWDTPTLSWLRIATTNNAGWSITGNSGLSAVANFIGTTDAVDVAFRRSNSAAGRIGATSTSLGVGALTANTGTNNTAFGTNALAANNSPGDNTAVGFNALTANTLNAGAGNLNTAVGSSSLASLNGGARNTAVGASALTGASGNASLDNVAVGNDALRGTGTITQSVAVGAGALLNSGTATTRSTAIGFNAGDAVTTSIENVFIGSNSQGFGTTARNQIAIGYNASANADNTVTLGNTAITTLRCAATVITALSDRRDKTEIVKLAEGIEFIKKLKPVTYTWNTRDKSKVGSKAVGFIAQDLLDLQQSSAIGDNLDLVTYDNPDRLEARYGNLLPVIVKGMQEQQELIEALQKSNAELLKINTAILERLERLEKK